MQTVEYMAPKAHCQPNLVAIGTVHCVSPDNWNVAEFLRSRTAASRNTVKAYEQDLSVFIKWSEGQGHAGPDSIERTDVLGWVVAMHDEGCAQKTMARRISGVRQYFQWLTRKGTISSDPTSKVQAPKGAQKLPRPLTREEINQLLDEGPPESPLDLRNRLIVELLYGSGLRVSELCGLNSTSFDRERELLEVEGSSKKRRTDLGSKAKRGRRVPMSLIARQLIELWLAEGSREFDDSCTPGRRDKAALFLNRRGNRMGRRDVMRVIHKLLESKGLPGRSPHALRHTFASHLLEGGADLRDVQELMGHDSIATTQIYTKVTNSELVTEHRIYHPRGKPSRRS